jgi:hypothetical protein
MITPDDGRDVNAGADFYERSMPALVHRWRKCIASGGDHVEQQYIVAENWLYLMALLCTLYLQ